MLMVMDHVHAVLNSNIKADEVFRRRDLVRNTISAIIRERDEAFIDALNAAQIAKKALTDIDEWKRRAGEADRYFIELRSAFRDCFEGLELLANKTGEVDSFNAQGGLRYRELLDRVTRLSSEG